MIQLENIFLKFGHGEAGSKDKARGNISSPIG